MPITLKDTSSVSSVSFDVVYKMIKECNEVAISTFLGVAYITKKEAKHLLDTNEHCNARLHVSYYGHGDKMTLILEHEAETNKLAQ